MILKNKLTKEILDIPYSEFRIKFAKEIQDAFESYRKTQLSPTSKREASRFIYGSTLSESAFSPSRARIHLS